MWARYAHDLNPGTQNGANTVANGQIILAKQFVKMSKRERIMQDWAVIIWISENGSELKSEAVNTAIAVFLEGMPYIGKWKKGHVSSGPCDWRANKLIDSWMFTTPFHFRKYYRQWKEVKIQRKMSIQETFSWVEYKFIGLEMYYTKY